MEKYHIKNIDCASCASRIEEGVRKLEDVRYVSVNFAAASITVDTNNMELVRQKIKEIEPSAELEEHTRGRRLVTTGEITENRWTIIKALTGLILLLTGLILGDKLQEPPLKMAGYLIYGTAYLIVGWKVLARAVRNIIHGQVFNEYFLMSIATLGAIILGEMAEAVAVMLFYVVGEFFQDVSVNRSRKSIQSLLELKPDYANLQQNGQIIKVAPESVFPGQLISVKPGEKVPLDGEVLEGISFVDTSPMTGESVPRKVKSGDEVLSGMINQNGSITVKVSRTFENSSLSGILELVENASSRKADTEKFITTFARYYTPVVVFAALLLAVLPPLLISGETFNDWVYRALVVLVVSCPCALVISIPLGYFGGIGAASRKGILVKGSNFLDALTQVKTMIFDKTGTLTRGEFKVSEVLTYAGFTKDEVLGFAALAESHSNHPIALSIVEATKNLNLSHSQGNVEEIAGHGIKAEIGNKKILVGNDRLMKLEQVTCAEMKSETGTTVYVAVDGIFAGHIIISDSLKPDAADAIRKLKEQNIYTVMLTGDNRSASESVAKKLLIDRVYSELLPEDKVSHLEMIMSEKPHGKTAFTGDGINDAPVLARADVGIAMGALGSDAAVETADIVLMTDSPLKVAEAIGIAKQTRAVVWQNIFFALGVKLIFIGLGVAGIATMWEAVFGDMGVALIAVFNAMRIYNSNTPKKDK